MRPANAKIGGRGGKFLGAANPYGFMLICWQKFSLRVLIAAANSAYNN